MILDRGTWSLERTHQEQLLAQRLLQLGVDPQITGDTTPEIRRDRFRAAIHKTGSSAIAGRGRDGKPVTFAQAFELIYSEAFVPPEMHENADGVRTDHTNDHNHLESLDHGTDQAPCETGLVREHPHRKARR